MTRLKFNFRLQFFFCLALAAVCFGQAAVNSSKQRLALNVPIEGKIAAGEAQSFALHLESNQFAVLVLEQKGVDLTLALDEAKGGDARRLLEIDGNPGDYGYERALFQSENGARDLLVRVFSARRDGETATGGAFSLALVELKPAEARDKLRLSAQAAILDGLKLGSKEKREFREQARRLYLESLKLARDGGDPIAEAYALAYLQKISNELEELNKSIEYGKAALELFVRQANLYEQAAARDRIGQALSTAGESDAAIEFLSKASEQWREIGDGKSESEALTEMSFAYRTVGDFSKAAEAGERAYRVAQSSGGKKEQTDALIGLSFNYFESGDFLKCIEVLDGAVSLAQEIKSNELATGAYNSLGRCANRLGQKQKAIDYFQQALRFKREIPGDGGSILDQATLLTNIARVYMSLGQHNRALDYNRQAAQLFGTLNFPKAILNNLFTTGLIQLSLKNYEKAKEAFNGALKISEESKAQVSEALVLHHLGVIETALERPEAALEYFKQSLQIRNSLRMKYEAGQTLDLLAGVYLRLKQFEKAAETAGASLENARAVADRVTESNALYSLARASRGQGDSAAARRFIENSLKIVESLRSELINQESRAAYFSTVRDKYDFYIDLLIELENQPNNRENGALAFAASERARARSLLDLLAESYVDVSGRINPELKRREQAIAAKLSALQTQLIRLKSAEKPNAPRRDALQTEIEKADVERERLESEIRRTNPRYAALKYPATLNLAQAQKLLDDKTVLLEYQTGAQNSYLFTVGRNEFQIVPLPNEQILRQSIESLRRSVTTPNRIGFANYLVAGRELYKTLLAPIENLLKTKTKIVVSADGALNYLPFEVLLTGDARSGFDKLPYLVRDFQISYTPSASVLANLKNNDVQKPAKSFLAFAAPDYAAKNAAQNAAAGNTRSVFGDDNRSWNLTDLKNAKT